MSIIKWDDSYSVNNTEIDEQHIKWIEIYNDALEHFLSRKHVSNAEIAANAIKKMHEYTKYHFEFEMAYMREILYPEIASHRRLHKNFDVLIYNLLRQANKGEILLCTEILKTIENWLLDHILVEDKKYCKFAAEQRTNLYSK